jgi:hypothetical protein
MRPSNVQAPNGMSGKVPTSHYASRHGVKLSNGRYAYRGRGHRHWTRKHFDRKRRAWKFYDPSTRGWYHFNKKRNSFLPESLASIAPPASPEDTPAIDVPEIMNTVGGLLPGQPGGPEDDEEEQTQE